MQSLKYVILLRSTNSVHLAALPGKKFFLLLIPKKQILRGQKQAWALLMTFEEGKRKTAASTEQWKKKSWRKFLRDQMRVDNNSFTNKNYQYLQIPKYLFSNRECSALPMLYSLSMFSVIFFCTPLQSFIALIWV